MQTAKYTFTTDELDKYQFIHDIPGYGPRAAYAVYLGRSATNTLDLDTNEVEDFIIAFYTQYNKTFGTRY